ncbi:MAG: hypothetical protein ACYC8S_03195 [Minisyncoccota bacterium]
MNENTELVDYIKSGQASGMSLESIKESLRASGWKDADIDKEMIAVRNDAGRVNFSSESSLTKTGTSMGASKRPAGLSMLFGYKFYLSVIVLAVINVLLQPYLYNYIFFPLFVAGQGWGALIVGGFFFLVIEVPLASLLSLITIRVFVRNTNKNSLASFILQFIFVLIIFVVIEFIGLYEKTVIDQQATQAAQKTFEKENPIDTGTKSLVLSKDVLFHTSIYPGLFNNHPVINDLNIKDNTVIWSERTQNAPPYKENVLDLFIFEFDGASSQGTSTQISHNEKADTLYKSVEDSFILNGKIYWTRENSDGDRTLTAYDTASGKEEVLFTDIQGLIGGYGNYLILARKNDTPLGDGSYRGGVKVSLYEISSKQETPIDVSPGVIDGNYMCYGNVDGSIGVYDIGTKEKLVIHTAAENLSAKKMELVYRVSVLACSKNYIIYSFTPGVPGQVSTAETHVYTIKTNGESADQKIDTIDKAKLIGEYLYYSNSKGVFQKNIVTGGEMMLLPLDNLVGWSTDGNYITYQKIDVQGKADFYLKKISQ